ncbi:MAG TPA: serine hydrolase domain-containing protein [Planctomycetaceae bacterium]|nr:serine hydrolase domain-containing protein [Planctomycetaceae bacterium]
MRPVPTRRPLIFWLLFGATCCGAACCGGLDSAARAAQKAKPLSKQAVEALDEAVDAERQRQQLVGVAVGIIRHGEVILTKGYGFADWENQIPVTTKTVFNWASNCKPLTAVAALQLVEQGKLDLEADVRKYVPEFSPNGPPITVRQLLCHQSGLPHWKNGRVVPAQNLDEDALASIDPLMTVRRFSESPLLFEPGTRQSYSSYGYILLSAVIERAGGESYFTQVEKRIAQPLGMESLQLDTSATQPNWAVGYTRTKVRPLVGVRGGFSPQVPGQPAQTPVGPAPEEAHAWKAGAGAFKSNIEDFSKWAAALLNAKMISKKTQRDLWTRQRTSDGALTEMGLGFFIGREGGSTTIYHSGQQTEVVTYMTLYLKPRHGIVLLCNCGYANGAELSEAIAKALAEP